MTDEPPRDGNRASVEPGTEGSEEERSGNMTSGDERQREDEDEVIGDEGPEDVDEVPWHSHARGDVLVTALVVATTVGVALSVAWGRSLVFVPPLRTTVPVDVYLYAFLGAIARAIATFVTDLEAVPVIGTARQNGADAADPANVEADATAGRSRDEEPDDGPTASGGDERGDGPVSAGPTPGDGTTDAETGGGGGGGETPGRTVVAGVSSKDVKRMALRVVAALCLAVGLFLTSDLVVQTFRYVDRPADPLMAGLAFVAGFYVDETYRVLGSIADRVLRPLSEEVRERERHGQLVVGKPKSTVVTGARRVETDTETVGRSPAPGTGAGGPGDEGDAASLERGPIEAETDDGGQGEGDEVVPDPDEGDRRWSESTVAGLLVGGGVILTTVAVVLSIDWGGPDDPYPPFLPAPPSIYPANRVPFDIYLYAFLGSMGYVFTSLFDRYDRSLRSLFRHALRAPVGPLLAAALFLLSALALGITTPRTAQFYAGVAFLVGLYTNVALLTFDVIAARLFGAIGAGGDADDTADGRETSK